MVESAKLFIKDFEFTLSGKQQNSQFIPFDESFDSSQDFAIQITFTEKISAFRNHNYQWTNLAADRFAGELAPKIIRLESGILVQANICTGYWEVNRKSPKTLRWTFDASCCPIASYEGGNNVKVIGQASRKLNAIPALLFSEKNAVELSRSKLPFSAVACFTDHCDFDTLKSLSMQREFFKSAGIRVTKGFFKYHYSKRADNASMEFDADELQKWKSDGHELAYHALSQSIRETPEALLDFTDLEPEPDVVTYIDHGFQPYNFSLYRHHFNDAAYANYLNEKRIRTLWNYIDSGTAGKGILNQMDAYNFTQGKFWSSIKRSPRKARIQKMLRNLAFHFDGSPETIKAYMSLAGSVKSMTRKSLKTLSDILKIAMLGGKSIVRWNSIKVKPFMLAKASPVMFRHQIADREFSIFQTIEMTDFKSALSAENLDNLVKDSGLFIAHTYFSAPMVYHTGKMFATTEHVDKDVAANFHYLGNLVAEGKIWNPTLRELADHLSVFYDAEFVMSDEGDIVLRNPNAISRKVIE